MEQQETEQTITIEQVFQKICEVQKALDKPKVEKGLWEIQDVANYCGFSYTHTYKNIVADPRFPPPVDIQSTEGSKKSKSLFLREEVIRFFEKHKKKKNRI